jgi:hypothetical protein
LSALWDELLGTFSSLESVPAIRDVRGVNSKFTKGGEEGMRSNDDDPINPFSRFKMHTLLAAARLLELSRSSIERHKASGKLGPWVQMGRRWYIRGSDIKRFIDSQPTTGGSDDAEMPEAAE